MKRINNLYQNIVDINKINRIYKVIRKNTKNKYKLYRFEEFYSLNVTNIYLCLKSKDYVPGNYNIFVIYEPKYRIIMSQQIGDKLINHLVASYILLPALEKSLINTNVATRIKRGTHYGIKYLKSYLNEMNGNIYALKFDITKYFYNIDHEILLKMLRMKIKDKDSLNILRKIIDSTDEQYVNKEIEKIKAKLKKKIENSNLSNIDRGKRIEQIDKLPLYKKGKGLPIGNMTSQIMAIFYLNDLDHFIKEKLHIKYYIRYMDDGIILCDDKKYLKYCLNQIKIELSKYKLELNNKTKIINITKEGVDFLGFRFYKKNRVIMRVRNDTKKRFKKKVKLIKKGFYDNIALSIIKSYEGHLKWGNCYNLYNNIVNN